MRRRDHEKELRRLSSTPPERVRHLQQMIAWNNSEDISNRDDREAILVSFNFLEQGLRKMLAKHLRIFDIDKEVQLFEGSGNSEAVLGSVYSRMIFAESVDLISSDCASDIRAINLIRNVFAHSGHDINFSNESLICLSDLKTLSSLQTHFDIVVHENAESEKRVNMFTLNLRSPRARIIGFIIMFFLYCGVGSVRGSLRYLIEFFGPLKPSSGQPVEA